MKKVSIFLSVLVIVVGMCVSTHAALVDMHDGTIYDTTTQLSWLKNANQAGTYMTWTQAVAWAASLNSGGGYAGFTNWRLPATAEPDATCTVKKGFYLFGCTGSEMGYLYYTSLGNAAGSLTHTEPFTNIQTGWYWSSTVYAPNPSETWYFYFAGGGQDHMRTNKSTFLYAWAVRPGARSTAAATPVPASGTVVLK